MRDTKDIISDYVPSERQRLAHDSLKTEKLYGGAVGGGKTVWLCIEAICLSFQYPGNRGAMFRYHLSDFKTSTLTTLLQWLPEDSIEGHNKTEGLIRLTNGSEILYMGLEESSADKQKFGSLEVGWFAIDEACEVPREKYYFLLSRLQRWKLPDGSHPPPYAILASNPADCWLRDYFVDKTHPGRDFIKALPTDNPYLHKDYVPRLREIYPEDWVERFLEGSWDTGAENDVIIHPEWIRMAINRKLPEVNKPVIGCDVARFGDDEIVIAIGNGNTLLEQDVTKKRSTMETAGKVMALSKKNNAQYVAVDDVNIGGGVTDRLREMRLKGVIPINGGAKANREDRYANLKTEIWWHGRELFKEGKVSIINDSDLIRQLSSVKYIYRSNGKIMAEPKDDTKKRLGCSPDRADALLMMLWAAKFCKDGARDFRRVGKKSPLLNNKYVNDYGWSYTNEGGLYG